MSRRKKAEAATTTTVIPHHGGEEKLGLAGRKMTSSLLLLLTSAVMLTLLFPPFYCFFLAPLALAPFVVCIIRRPLSKRYLLAFYGLGAVFFTGNLYWIAPVTVFGLLALALFVALYFVLFAVGVHRLVVDLRLPATVAVPLVWTAVEYLRSTFVLGGFPWFMLGNCLTPMPVLIQAADIFGVWGLSFVMAMMNGFVVDLLRLPLRQVVKGKPQFSPALRRLTMCVVLLVGWYIGYGVFRLQEETTQPGPRIAVIQENIPQSMKESGAADSEIFERHVQLTLAALKADPKPDLVAWPETMVPGFGNPEFLNARNSDFAGFIHPDFWPSLRDDARDYLDVLQKVSDTSRVPLLLGMGSLEPRKTFSDSIKQNRTMLMEPDRGVTAYYAKIHLVPFGEVIPFRKVPWLGKQMLMFSPLEGEDFSDIPGTVWTRFTLPVRTRSVNADTGDITTSLKNYKFATPICFEDTMPEPARQMSAPQYDGGMKAHFLINVSNDGWFQWVELEQHLQACQLRAVENRIPIARSVNTGNSGFIDSCGRIVKLVRDAHGSSIGAVGTESWQMQIDSRVTFFSRIGDLFPIICGILSTLLVGWTLLRPRRAKPGAGTSDKADAA